MGPRIEGNYYILTLSGRMDFYVTQTEREVIFSFYSDQMIINGSIKKLLGVFWFWVDPTYSHDTISRNKRYKIQRSYLVFLKKHVFWWKLCSTWNVAKSLLAWLKMVQLLWIFKILFFQMTLCEYGGSIRNQKTPRSFLIEPLGTIIPE